MAVQNQNGRLEEIMKKINILIAVFSVAIAAASVAKAGERGLDFDGRGTGSTAFADLLQKSDSGQDSNITLAAIVPEKVEVGAVGEVKVMVSIKTGAEEKKETLLCQGDSGKKELRDCKKKSDSRFLMKDDVVEMALRRFFPSEDDGTLLPARTRHAYCNQSGPEFFNCIDKHVDPNWVAKGKKVKYTTECDGKVEYSYSGFPTISGGVNCSHTTEEEIDYVNEPYWTHECEKVDHC